MNTAGGQGWEVELNELLHSNLLYSDRKCFDFTKGKKQLVTESGEI